MNPLAQQIASQLERYLTDRRVVVWYDSRREWLPVFADLSTGRTTFGDLETGAVASLTVGSLATSIACFRGSYLGVRLIAEPITCGDIPQPLILYLPGETSDEDNSVLAEMELGGKCWSPHLKAVARAVLKPFYVDGKIDELLDVANLTYSDVVGWLEQVEEHAAGHGSMLRLVFPGVESSAGILAEWLTHPEHDTAIRAKNAAGELYSQLTNRLGVAVSQDDSVIKARERTWRYLLVNEFRADLHGPVPSGISLFPAPATENQLKAVRQVLTTLRGDHSEEYRGAADRVETELQLRQAGVNAADFGAVDTFRFEEQALLGWCDKLLALGRYDEALAVERDRSSSFWVDNDLTRKAQWSVCERLAELGTKVARIENELGKFSGSATSWVEAYSQPGGWWEMDQVHRQLETLVAGLEDEPELSASLNVIRQRYEVALQKMAVGFSSALQQAKWHIADVMAQTSVYPEVVSYGGGPVAYFLVDAMRYEMAQALASQLGSTAAVQVHTATAALPTITKIGMAALLPGSSESFNIGDEKGKVGARVGGSFLPDWPARKKYWKARIPDMLELDLSAVLTSTPKKLEAKIGSAPVLLVRSGEIDELGESGQNHIARQVMATVLGNLVSAVRKLARAGLSRFVLTADHGYQFVAERGDEMKTENPGGQQVELHRRCWIGRGGQNPPGTIRVSSADLGYEGNLEFVFPTGLGIFKSGGDLAYHHGGLSLQELVIPVVTIRMEASQAEKGALRKIIVSGAPPTLSTRTLGIKLSLGPFDTGDAVEVRPVLVSGSQEVGKAGMAVGADLDANTQCLKLTPGQEVMVGILLEREDVASVKVVVLDPNTGAVLGESAEIAVKLGM